MTTYNLSSELGIKSFSFREIKENADVAAAVKACKVTNVDLSACHVNYDDIAAQKQAIDTYRQAGVGITGIGVVGVRNDEAFNRRFFDFARLAGCNIVSCSFPPADHMGTLAILEKLCEEYGMRAAIHNHGGAHWLGNSSTLGYLFGLTSERIGLCIDTAWCLDSGEDPVKWLDIFSNRIYGVHFKDFTFNPNGHPSDTILGEGALDLPAFVKRFLQLPFNGSAVVEYEGDNAVEMSAKCVEAIRKTLRDCGT